MRSIRLPSGKEVIVEVTRSVDKSVWMVVVGRVTRLADGAMSELFPDKTDHVETTFGNEKAELFRRVEAVTTTVSIAPKENPDMKMIGTSMWKAQPARLIEGIFREYGDEQFVEVSRIKRHDPLSKRVGRIRALEDLFRQDNKSDRPTMQVGTPEAFKRLETIVDNFDDTMADVDEMIGEDKMDGLREKLVAMLGQSALVQEGVRTFLDGYVTGWNKERRLYSRADRQFLVAYVCPTFASDKLSEEVKRCTTYMPDPAKADAGEETNAEAAAPTA